MSFHNYIWSICLDLPISLNDEIQESGFSLLCTTCGGWCSHQFSLWSGWMYDILTNVCIEQYYHVITNIVRYITLVVPDWKAMSHGKTPVSGLRPEPVSHWWVRVWSTLRDLVLLLLLLNGKGRRQQSNVRVQIY